MNVSELNLSETPEEAAAEKTLRRGIIVESFEPVATWIQEKVVAKIVAAGEDPISRALAGAARDAAEDSAQRAVEAVEEFVANIQTADHSEVEQLEILGSKLDKIEQSYRAEVSKARKANLLAEEVFRSGQLRAVQDVLRIARSVISKCPGKLATASASAILTRRKNRLEAARREQDAIVAENHRRQSQQQAELTQRIRKERDEHIARLAEQGIQQDLGFSRRMDRVDVEKIKHEPAR